MQAGLHDLHWKYSGLSLFAFVGLCDVLAGGRFTGVWPTAENRFRIKHSKDDGIQDGEHMYTCGGFILIFGKTNTVM